MKRIRDWVFAITLMLAGMYSRAGAQTVPTASAVVIEIHGQIDDYERDRLRNYYDRARESGAKTVILSIDTWGGLVTSALEISQLIKSQDGIRTIAYVNPKAISAGALIAMACDEIIMAPSSIIGDCAPISFRTDGTLEALPPAERAKAESPVLADFRDSARRNHHDVLLAETMVSVGRTAHWIEEKDGSRAFVDDAEYAKRIAAGAKPVAGVPEPLDAADQLLTMRSELAVTLGLAKGTASSVDALAQERGLTITRTFSPGVGDAMVEALASPLARLVLIIIFVVSLKLALAIPGHGAPEAFALISIGLLVGMPLLTGYAQWWEIGLIFLGLALLAFEIFVFPGHFVSAAVGIVMIVGGLILTFVPREPAGPGWMPGMNSTWHAMEKGLLIVTGGMACSLLLWVWLNKYLPKLPYFNRLVLNTVVGSTGMAGATIEWPAVGAVGTCMTDLKPGGSAQFTDPDAGALRNASVVSDSGFLPAGAKVVVTASQRGYALVKKFSPPGNLV